MRGKQKSVFKLVSMKEPLHWKKPYPEDWYAKQIKRKTALVEIPYHMSHLTIPESDQVISEVVHIWLVKLQSLKIYYARWSRWSLSNGVDEKIYWGCGGNQNINAHTHTQNSNLWVESSSTCNFQEFVKWARAMMNMLPETGVF